MSTLEDDVLRERGIQYSKALSASMRKALDDAFTYAYGMTKPDYYAKRKYGKWTIYNKEGWRVAHGLNEKEKNNYMKLLEVDDGTRE